MDIIEHTEKYIDFVKNKDKVECNLNFFLSKCLSDKNDSKKYCLMKKYQEYEDCLYNLGKNNDIKSEQNLG